MLSKEDGGQSMYESGSGEVVETNAAIHRPGWISRNHLSTFMSLWAQGMKGSSSATQMASAPNAGTSLLESQQVMTALGNRFLIECDRSECRAIR
jgi:hypothetical protein